MIRQSPFPGCVEWINRRVIDGDIIYDDHEDSKTCRRDIVNDHLKSQNKIELSFDEQLTYPGPANVTVRYVRRRRCCAVYITRTSHDYGGRSDG